MADLQRWIPSMVDGLTPEQRKILFSCFKKNLTKEINVAQFSYYVSKHSAYNHGTQSLVGTIVGMAQDFVGSNNINLLLPKGKFGTRSTGGIEHRICHEFDRDIGRYIYTRLSPITRCLFPEDDDILLDYLDQDGQKIIEPTWYVPIIPMVLVNGTKRIGAGWSTYVPNYNPRDIVANVRRLINGEPTQPMDPWYKGFKGTIEKTTATNEAGESYTVSGLIKQIDANTLEITELPIRRWINDYKQFLESMMTGNDEMNEPFIKDYKDNGVRIAQYYGDNGDAVTVKLLVTMSEDNLLMAKKEGLLKKFKLTTTISTSNMHLFDSKGVIKKYDNPEQIIEDFFHVRLELYKKRQKVQLEILELDLLKLDNKVRFILGVVEGKIRVSHREKADLFLELKEKGFTPFPKMATDAVDEEASQAGDYDYLLQMDIGTLTLERVQKLLKERDQLQGEVDELRKASPMPVWNKDLDALDAKLDAQDKRDAREEVERQRIEVYQQKWRDERMNGPGHKPSGQAPKNPRKINKNVISTATVAEPMDTSAASKMETDTVHEVVNPKGKARAKKAPIKKGKSTSTLRDKDDDETRDLKDRVAANNLESLPDQSEVMEVEVPQKQAKKKPPSRKNNINNEDIEVQGEDNSDDGDFEVEVVVKKKGGRKPATAGKAKAAKPPAATKKRGPAASSKQSKIVGQNLIRDVLEPVENDAGMSPEKKVRKMRASPYNKKSGSLLGRAAAKDPKDELMMSRVTRPQRANRTKTTYVLSDSEGEKEASDDSELNEN